MGKLLNIYCKLRFIGSIIKILNNKEKIHSYYYKTQYNLAFKDFRFIGITEF